MLRLTRLVKNEAIKFLNNFNKLILCFVCLQTILVVTMRFNELDASSAADLRFFQIFNYSFGTVVFSIIPFILIFSMSKEFSSGYASKLICNGLERKKYFKTKLILSVCLSVFVLILYSVILFFTFLLSGLKAMDLSVLRVSYIALILGSLFVNFLVLSLLFFFKKWQYAVVAYIVYSFVEGLCVFHLQEKSVFINVLPLQACAAIFRLEHAIGSYSLPTQILVLVLIATILIVTSFRHFQKADLTY